VSRYAVYITPEAWAELKDLPGHMRQRVKRAIHELAETPRPTHSQELSTPELKHELRRLRIEKWRVVYAVTETNQAVDVLAIRKRPPYDYGDLEQLSEEIEER